MTIEDTPPPSVASERAQRRRKVVIGLAVALTMLVAIVTAVALAATHRPHVDWYETDGATLEVTYYLGAGEQALWERVDESDERIVVDLMVVATLPPGVPRNAMAEGAIAAFELDAPVGDREVVTPDGEVLSEAGGE